MGKNACVFFALQLFVMTLSIYGFMFGITSKADVLVQSIGLGIGSWFQVLAYYCVCNMAHKVTLKVRMLLYNGWRALTLTNSLELPADAPLTSLSCRLLK
jgi:hypothetical protein